MLKIWMIVHKHEYLNQGSRKVVLYVFISSTFAWHNEICLSYFGSEISLPLSLALHVPLVLKIAVLAKQGKVPLCRTVLLRLFKAGSSV